MSDSSTDNSGSSQSSLDEWVDDMADRFEAAWDSSHSLSEIVAFLGDLTGDRRRVLLCELIKTDFECRWRAGNECHLDEYVSAIPELLRPDGIVPDDVVMATQSIAERHGGDVSMGASLARSRPRVVDAAVRIRCPHCGQPVQIVERDAPQVTCASCGSTFHVEQERVSAATSPPLPRTLGKFQLLDVLGSGAFGTVYKARDSQLGRTVAVKLPRSGYFGSDEERQRFVHEARSAARLSHSGIVQVHEIGHEGDLTYIVTDLIDGQTLPEYAEQEGLSINQTANVVAEIADALQAAHTQGVIHRDVKPNNVLIDRQGHPHLADFGLARDEANEAVITLDGQILGTPAYMSPEQAAGHPKEVGASSDIYSLGVILYELLTHECPFQGNMRMLLHQVQEDEPRPPRRLNDRIPRDLETICLKCMAKSPTRRYASAGHLAADLRRFVRGEPIQARPVGRPERYWRWCRRNPALATTATIAVLALMTGTVISIWFAINESIHATKLSEQTALTEKHLVEARKLAREKTRLAEAESAARENAELGTYNVQLQRVQTALSTEPARALELLEDTDRCPVAVRDFTWGLFHNFADAERWIVHGHQFEVECLAFSPDGKTVASAGADKVIRLWEVATGRPLETLEGHKEEINSLEFSPDGTLLASGGGTPLVDWTTGEVKLWDLRNNREVASFDDHKEPVFAVAFSPDGKVLASACRDKTVVLWDVEKKERTRTLEGHTASVGAVCFSPDGKTLATGSGDTTVKLWDVSRGVERATLSGHEQAVNCVVFSPDGSRLITGSLDYTARVWDVEKREELLRCKADDYISSLAVSPNGAVLATCGIKEAVTLWETATGRQIGTLTSHAGWLDAVAFSPTNELAVAGNDGIIALLDPFSEPVVWAADDWIWHLAYSPDGNTLAAVGSQSIQLWDTATGQLRLKIEDDQIIGRWAAFSHDGRLVAAPGREGCVLVFEVATGTKHQTFRAHREQTGPLAFSPDGRTLAVAGDTGIRTWDVSTGEPRVRLAASSIIAIEFCSGGKCLRSLSRGGDVRRWDLSTGKSTLELHVRLDRSSGDWIAVSPDGKTVGVPGPGKTVALWDIGSGCEQAALAGHTDEVHGAVFSRDGKILASASDDRSIRLWDARTGLEQAILLAHTDKIRAIAFSPDGRSLASAGHDGTIRIWKADTPRASKLGRHMERVKSVAFSPDGMTLASASMDQTVRLFDFRGGRELATLRGHTPWLACVQFSPDGKTLASADSDGDIKLWNVATHRERIHWNAPEMWIESIRFSPDGKWVASASQDGIVRLWDSSTGKPIAWVDESDVSGSVVDFSPRGDLMATGSSSGAICIWDLTSRRRLVAREENEVSVTSLTFSGNGKWLAVGRKNGGVELWHVPTLEFDRRIGQVPPAAALSRRIYSRGTAITSLAFSPTCALLAVAGEDRMVRLWDVANGELQTTLIGHDDAVMCVAFSPDGMNLVSASDDKTVKVWQVARVLPRPARSETATNAVPVPPENLITFESVPFEEVAQSPREQAETALRHNGAIVSSSDLGVSIEFEWELRSEVGDDMLPHIATLGNVTSLWLGGTEVSDKGLVHIENLKDLTWLTLRGTAIGDSGLAHLAGLTSLRSLDLDDTRISNAGLVHLAGLRQLENLSLQRTATGDEGLVHLAGLTRLKRLSLSETDVSGQSLVVLENMRSLEEVNLDQTAVSDSGLAPLRELSALAQLDLSETQVTGVGFASLARLDHITSLDLRGAPVTDEGLSQVANLRSLQDLSLNRTKITTSGLRSLANLPHLQQLSLDDTAIGGSGIEVLAELTELKSLSLSDTRITDDDLKGIGRCVGLVDLNLWDTSIGDDGLQHLANLPRLQSLNLTSTGVTDNGLGHLEKMKNLKEVVLSWSRVTESGLLMLRQARPGLRIEFNDDEPFRYDPPIE